MNRAGKIIVLVSIAGVGILALKRARAPRTETIPEQAASKIPVEVTEVVRSTVEETVHTKGTLHALKEAVISPKMPGKLSAILVDEGDRVQPGQLVAQLEDSPFVLGEQRAHQGLLQAQAALAQSNAAIAQAEADFERIKEDCERMERLYERESIAKQQYDHALSGFRVSEAGLRQAKEQRALAEAQVAEAKVAIDLARTQLEDTRITSPIAGTITQKSMNLGEMAAPGREVFTVEQLDTLELKADVSSLLLGRLKIGMSVRVSVDGLDGVIMGQIDEISPRVDPRLRTVEITIRLGNEAGTIRPGVFASADVILQRREEVLAVPTEAVLGDGEDRCVFRVEDGVARRTPVMIGLREGPVLEVLEGLNEGDRIVKVGQQNLVGGEPVLIQGEGT